MVVKWANEKVVEKAAMMEEKKAERKAATREV